MPVLGSVLVELRVADRVLIVDWYVKCLGLEMLLDDPEGDFTLLSAGVAVKGGQPEEGSSSVALLFRVDDLGSVLSRLVAAGETPWGPKSSPEGYREIGLTDPAGHGVRLYEWTGAGEPPGST